ncbi:hypothetical protein [Streptomyces sp. NPDC048581]|uniref:hypothetical protein n=1 Tax=unclassified Streptomyces TaxID=2593676 RepID=UPI003720CECB
MNLIGETLPQVIGGLVVAALLGGVSWAAHQVRPRRTARSLPVTVPRPAHPGLRTYALLGTMASDGRPVRRDTTWPPGTVITATVDGRAQRFQLTDASLYDGTFAAEPLDRHL